MKRDFKVKNPELIANGTLTKSIDFRFDLQYSSHSQLAELYIKRKPWVLVHVNENSSKYPRVFTHLSLFLVEILDFTKTTFASAVFYRSE